MLALATCRRAHDIDTDLPLLQRELPDALIADWDDPTVDWSAFETVIVRSTWDYHLRRDDFLAWVAAVARVARLWNAPALIEWNTDKRYLATVSGWGVPTVPTTYLADATDIVRFAGENGFTGDLVVKPTIGASAAGVRRFTDDDSAAVEHAHDLLRSGRAVMVQPYLTGVDRDGETGLVYLGGEFSHAFGRRVVLEAQDADDLLGDERSATRRCDIHQRALGDAVMRRLPATAYARIDLIPTNDGPVVLEVEVTEPSLFLHLDDDAPPRAAAVFRSL